VLATRSGARESVDGRARPRRVSSRARRPVRRAPSVTASGS
jgi:hypothetical protein